MTNRCTRIHQAPAQVLVAHAMASKRGENRRPRKTAIHSTSRLYFVSTFAYNRNMKTDADIVRMLKAAIAVAGSLRKWAKANDFSASYISDVMTGRRDVTERLAAAFGFERVNRWQKKVKE
jgi:hypothetical protein